MKYAIVTRELFLSAYDGVDLAVKIAWTDNEMEATAIVYSFKKSSFYQVVSNEVHTTDADYLSLETGYALSSIKGFNPDILTGLRAIVQRGVYESAG